MENMKLTNVHLKNIKFNDPFWNRYIDLVDDVILPFQWELINDNVEGAEKSYCMKNFRIACGDEEGKHQGMVFQDTDVAKCMKMLYKVKRKLFYTNILIVLFAILFSIFFILKFKVFIFFSLIKQCITNLILYFFYFKHFFAILN